MALGLIGCCLPFLFLYFVSMFPPAPNSGCIDRGLERGGTRWNFWRQIVGGTVTARLLYLIWTMTFTIFYFRKKYGNMWLVSAKFNFLGHIQICITNPFILRYTKSWMKQWRIIEGKLKCWWQCLFGEAMSGSGEV